MRRAFGIRAKLFLAAFGLSLAVLVPGGLYLQRELRTILTDRIEREIDANLHAARTLFEATRATTPEEIDALADRLAQGLHCRITVIARDGTVLGDSDVPLARLPELDNHRTRPEVAEAFEHGTATSRRHSATVDSDLIYRAAPYHDRAGVVRVARPLGEIADALARLRWLLAIAGVLSAVASLVLSAIASQIAARTMSDMVDSARALAAGGGEPSSTRRPEDAERVMAEIAIERARFAAVLEGMGEGVVALDKNGVVTLINPAARTLLGTDGGATGRSLLEVVRAPALDELVAAGAAGGVEIELASTRRRVSARLAPQAGGGAILVLHDVTALHRLETIRRDFVANVSHELRTPVSVISANAETLQDGALSDTATAPRLVEAIQRNALRLTDLIDDLLDLSRLEAGSYKIDLEEVDLGAAALRAVDQIERMAEKRRTSLTVEAAPGIVAAADAGALHQVLVNVVTNAIVHTPEGTKVRIHAARAGDRVRVEVRDDGNGIPAAHRERIFERFYRIDAGRSRDRGGTGLGLSIVRHLVEAMSGQVGVRENAPRGAVVWIELPAGADPPANAADA